MNNLYAKILSEGYCCLHGYLRLCAARGEKRRDMAKFIGVHKRTIYLHYEAMKKGNRPCTKQGDCMLPIISQIEKETLSREAAAPEAE